MNVIVMKDSPLGKMDFSAVVERAVLNKERAKCTPFTREHAHARDSWNRQNTRARLLAAWNNLSWGAKAVECERSISGERQMGGKGHKENNIPTSFLGFLFFPFLSRSRGTQFTLVTRRPYCPGRPKELCFTTLCLPMETMGMRLSVVKLSFFGPPGQYGRFVEPFNLDYLRLLIIIATACAKREISHLIGKDNALQP